MIVVSLDQRSALEALVRERREDYASLSRLIGRNPSYIQQFVKRGVPRKLDEADRRTLARYFDVPESRLGGPPNPPRPVPRARAAKGGAGDLVLVPQVAIRASAGPGTLAADEHAGAGTIAFDAGWLRALTGTATAELAMLTVDGDSMSPTLENGDDILVDRGDAAGRLRDGIYLLRRDEALHVKRLALSPVAATLSVRSDNPRYGEWQCAAAEIDVIGRVVWAGRRLR